MRKKSASRASRLKKDAHKEKQAARPNKEKAALKIKPVWDAENHILWWNGIVVKHIERPAANLELILSAFQELGWPEYMDNPLGGAHIKAHEHLRDAIKKLSRGQDILGFHGGGSGKGIRWEVVAVARPG